MGILSYLNCRLRTKNDADYKTVFKRDRKVQTLMLSRIDKELGMPGYERHSLVKRLPENQTPKDGSPRRVLEFMRTHHEVGPMTAKTLAIHLPLTIYQVKNAIRHLQRNNYVVQTNMKKGEEKDYEAID